MDERLATRQLVGNVTQFVLPNVTIDDYVFGVAAIGADGHESLVSAYVAAPLAGSRGEVGSVEPLSLSLRLSFTVVTVKART